LASATVVLVNYLRQILGVLTSGCFALLLAPVSTVTATAETVAVQVGAEDRTWQRPEAEEMARPVPR
jgi:hypothetical protein